MTTTPISQPAPPAIPGSALAAYVWDTYVAAPEHVIFLGNDTSSSTTHVYEFWYAPGTGFWSYQDLTAITGALPPVTGSALAGYAWDTNNSQHVIFLGNDTSSSTTHVYELCFSSEANAWCPYNDLTDVTGALSSPTGSALAGYVWDTDNTEHVICLGNDTGSNTTHVCELWRGQGDGSWCPYNDLTNDTGSSSALAGSALAGYGWVQNSSEYVTYLDSNYNINQLCLLHGGQWATNGQMQLAIPGSPLVGYTWDADSTEQIIFLDTDSISNKTHVYELRLITKLWQWEFNDLTDKAGAPPPIAGSALAAYAWPADNSQHVVFLGTDPGSNETHVYDLRCTSSSGWQCKDLTHLTGALPPIAGSALAAYTRSDQSSHVICQCSDSHIYDLSYNRGTGIWKATDLTATATSGSYPPSASLGEQKESHFVER